MNWKWDSRKRSWHFRYYHGRGLLGLRVQQKILCYSTWFLGKNLNPGTTRYQSGLLTNRHWHLFKTYIHPLIYDEIFCVCLFLCLPCMIDNVCARVVVSAAKFLFALTDEFHKSLLCFTAIHVLILTFFLLLSIIVIFVFCF